MSFDPVDVLGDGGAVASRLDGWEMRPAQVEMAGSVRRNMSSGGQLLIEAGTGLGKSFAYLLPAIERVVTHGERVVIATNTIALQEQLMGRDVPFLGSLLPGPCRAVLVKGRGNYLSKRRLALARSREQQLFSDASSRRSLHAIDEWAEGTRDGTLATLPVLERRGAWDHVQSDSGNCLGRRCPTYETCFYQEARRAMEGGDLLICNHAMFFSDLALRISGNSVLPRYDHVVFDEAHAMEDVASSHFGLRVTERGLEHLLGLLWQPRKGKGFLAALDDVSDAGSIVAACKEQVVNALAATNEFFNTLLEWHRANGKSNGRIAAPGIVENTVTGPYRELEKSLLLLQSQLPDEADVAECARYAERVRAEGEDVRRLLMQEIPGAVYWLDGTEAALGRGGRQRGPRPGLRCMIVEVAPVLREHLFDSGVSVTMTSATLATGDGDFSHVAERLGCEDAATEQLASPFHYADQMRLLVDRSMPPPSSPDHLESLVSRINSIVEQTRGGAFILFTSFRMIQAVADKAGPVLGSIGPVLVQGRDGTPGQLMDRFRDDDHSILLGTSSFWQGVDVRGHQLRNVIITRLPFEVPALPIVEARSERIVERGGHPFMEFQVPRAVIRFRQGIGRLIRSSMDEGIVAVLDPRIVTKGYGKQFLASVPEGVPVEDLGEPVNGC